MPSRATTLTENRHHRLTAIAEVSLLVLLFVGFRGAPPPAINEAHYLALAKNFWQPTWCDHDQFVTSDKTHLLFHVTFGALTQFMTLPMAAWVGRLLGWTMLAIALRGLCRAVSDQPFACLSVAMLWMLGVEYFHLAGEWVIGGIEAKVPAYALVLVGMTRIARGDWPKAWPWFGLASAFHVLVGGWTVVAALFAYTIVGRQQSSPRIQIPWLLLGGLLACLGIFPALQTSVGSDPGDSVQAAKVYTYWRIAHHLLPSAFPLTAYLRHGACIAAMLWVAWPCRQIPRFRGLFWLAIGCLLITSGGLLVGLLPAFAPDRAAGWLRYYWFRAGDAMVPLTLGLAAITRPWPTTIVPGLGAGKNRRTGRVLAGDTWPALIAAVTFLTFLFQSHPLPPAVSGFPVPTRANFAPSATDVQQDWLIACEWARQALPADEVLITPRHQQTFKWYAERAEVVNWKDVPQDAKSMLEWRRRFFDIFPQRLGTMRTTIRYDDLRRFFAEYGSRFMIVDRRVVGESLPLVQAFPPPESTSLAGKPQTYAVYRLPQPAVSNERHPFP